MNMFPANVLSPSPIYQSMFRAPVMTGQPMTSASFLMEGLLRERAAAQSLLAPQALLARPIPGGLGLPLPAHSHHSPQRSRGRADSPRDSPPSSPPPLRRERDPRDSSPSSPRDSPEPRHSPPHTTTQARPYLKFGVSAILSSEVSPKASSDHKQSKYLPN